MIARTRERSQNAKNIKVKIRKTREFETSTFRESSNFERIKAEMIILHNEDVASKIQNVLNRADSAFKRKRERKRARERERKRKRERARAREFTVAVAVEKRENVIFEVDEKESKKREREQSRDRKQAVLSKET